MWRSWLARAAGGREVAGSSPVTPTMQKARRLDELFASPVWGAQFTSAFYDRWVPSPPDHDPGGIVGFPCKLY